MTPTKTARYLHRYPTISAFLFLPHSALFNMVTPSDDDPLGHEADNEAEDDQPVTGTEGESQRSVSGANIGDYQRIVKITEAPNASRRKVHASAATQDAKLREFLANADEIESVEHFKYWKDEFLETFRKYLDPEGTASARESDEELYSELERLGKICMKVKEQVREGRITPDSTSVKGQRSISEMISSMATAEGFIKAYWPKTQEEEVICGYSKFELAAVLVRDGFRVYGLMVATRDYVQALSEGPLRDILKPNQKSIIHFYFRSIDSFVDTMADLGMYTLMQKCVEIFKVRPRKKKTKKYDRTQKDALSDTSGSDIINGGRMFQRSKQKFRSIMDNGWASGLTKEEIMPPIGAAVGTTTSGNDGGISGETAKDRNAEDSEKSDFPKLNAEGKENDDEEEVHTEFVYYFDPVNEIVGKVPRVKCFAENIILTIDDGGNENAEGAIDEWESKDGNVGRSEMILKLKEILRGKAAKKSEGLESLTTSKNDKKLLTQKHN
jgi:hypothetical protein